MNIYHSGVIMSAMVSQITGVTIVYPTVCSGADQRKHQRWASLAFVWGIHRWPVNSPQPVNSPHKGPVMRKRFPFHDVVMATHITKDEVILNVYDLGIFDRDYNTHHEREYSNIMTTIWSLTKCYTITKIDHTFDDVIMGNHVKKDQVILNVYDLGIFDRDSFYCSRV